ncbi:glycosyltransferase family 2 protein [Bacillus massiliigorillae]|uniref:glycosyltransferase family 2 protein n=1 Tax=Bacillus massiliigorillae TaxID=1243664 RepID=UPI0005AA8D5E|nr:glycosyltransferase [Bacillus massiliigorillae]
MKLFFFITNAVFWSILLYYMVLTFAGLYHRFKSKKRSQYIHYPSLDIFIPSHNEGIVMKKTLEAMAKLEYPGNMQIYILNDQSTDETGEIAQEFASLYHHIHHVVVPDNDEPKGKSRVLNYGLSISDGEYFIVYDADNQPNKDAAVRLMETTLQTKKAAGAVGVVRTMNAEHSLLTRFIAIEFQIFQLLMQSGRYALHKIGSLPGTNMLLKRSILEEMGGYDPYALAEDAELTIRLASKGYIIAGDPHSQTWEQEPQSLKALIRQRTRWLQGNLYIMLKFFKEPSWWKVKCFVHLTYYLTVYVIFTFLLLASNAAFVIGLLFGFSFETNIPYMLLWYLAYFIYTMQLIIAITYDRMLTGKNVVAAAIMYFSYAQLFIFLLFRSIIMIMKDRRKGTVSWDKTDRVSV